MRVVFRAGLVRPCQSENTAFRQRTGTLRYLRLTCVPRESICNKRKCNKKSIHIKVRVPFACVLGEKCGFKNIIQTAHERAKKKLWNFCFRFHRTNLHRFHCLFDCKYLWKVKYSDFQSIHVVEKENSKLIKAY